MDESRREMLRCIYEQNWEHYRHAENERLGFTAIYCAVVSGVLSFLTGWEDRGSLAVSVALTAFLLLFTVLGLLVSLRIGSAIQHHREKLESALDQMVTTLKLKGRNAEKWQEIGAPGTWQDWTARFRLLFIFPAFYCLAFFTVLSVLIAVVL